MNRPSRSDRNGTTSTTLRSTQFRTSAGSSGELFVVIGDSITNEGRTEIAATFGGSHRVVIDGRPGYVIAQQQSTAEGFAADRPSVVIVELGTNDVLSGRDLATSAADLRHLVATIADARCVVLVTVADDLPRSDASDRAAVIDRTIDSIAASDPTRFHVVDVDAVARAAADDPSFVGPFLYDGIHPSAAAQSRLVDAYAAAVAACGP